MIPRNQRSISLALALFAVLTIGSLFASRPTGDAVDTAVPAAAFASTIIDTPDPTIAPTPSVPDPTTVAPTPSSTEPPSTTTTAAPVSVPPTTTAPRPTPASNAPNAAYEYVALNRGAPAAQPETPAPAPPAAEAAPEPTPGPAPEPDSSGDPLASLSPSDRAFLACVRWRESRENYTAVNASSGAGGAYQFLQNTWNNTASHAGRGDLIGIRANYASKYDQDSMAVHLLQWYGRSPWAGSC